MSERTWNTTIIRLRPGSEEARKRGCTCPICTDAGKGPRQIDPECPVHGLPPEARDRPEPIAV